jgi:ankyrin repeat protein
MPDTVDTANTADTAEKPTKEQQIIRAAKNGDAATVRALIEADPALLNARDKDGSTPLHCASWKGHVEVVTLLLGAGADVNARNQNDHWGDTALHAAAHGNQRAVAVALLAGGADSSALNSRGLTPLAETRIHDAKAVANFLRQQGVTE